MVWQIVLNFSHHTSIAESLPDTQSVILELSYATFVLVYSVEPFSNRMHAVLSRYLLNGELEHQRNCSQHPR